ncbi:hypothetical protein PTTG_06519 [Puccinia triticina 1-1 BBBD Race 1]|uniref:RRP7 domain-containing protein n=2 Tax=Puccinia triticina TaxID=208348 RepID=A0A0C4F0A3_PUCT1|nr:uncharacterized protein PtA15_5A932 [Puccinia triticina]OAV91683.1 hypothetical protein PTTG_06519 [Puccinia triticina 1-1 BBBD Race 1]WAQ85357.1 hypothetical protein PtA15_5A932 [Puccinia triticina]WAR58648.1 hypothetical protein PtB15_5B883 [Puccinia triticina]
MITYQPLFYPFNETSAVDQSGSVGWMAGYRSLRTRSRPPLKEVKQHCDRWMAEWEAGRTPKLPQDEREEAEEPSKGTAQDGEEDGGGWTVVSRGGQHGRSATATTTISTQPQSKPRGADPYAQSSMADRDASAAVKVMKRNFAKTLSEPELADEESSSKKKRRGGQLNIGFYRGL